MRPGQPPRLGECQSERSPSGWAAFLSEHLRSHLSSTHKEGSDRYSHSMSLICYCYSDLW